MKIKHTVGFILALSACSSNNQQKSSETEKDSVVARIDELSSRPSWLKESDPFTIEGGIVTSLGSTEIPATDRVDAAYRIAENNAKASIAKSIESRLDFVFQNAEEGTGFDTTQARYIGAEASKLTTSSIHLGKRYWEKVASTSDTGERRTKYKVFVTVTMSESDFKAAIMNAISKREGKAGLSADFAKKVDDHWNQFVAGEKQ